MEARTRTRWGKDGQAIIVAGLPQMMFCSKCKKKLGKTEPRVVIDGMYHCAECVYLAERGLENNNPKQVLRDARLRKEAG